MEKLSEDQVENKKQEKELVIAYEGKVRNIEDTLTSLKISSVKQYLGKVPEKGG